MAIDRAGSPPAFGCLGKERYGSAAAARAAVDRLIKVAKMRHGKSPKSKTKAPVKAAVYFCPHCGGFHWGNDRRYVGGYRAIKIREMRLEEASRVEDEE